MCGFAGHEDGPSDGSSAGACCRAELGSRWPSEPCKASIALVRCKRAALARDRTQKNTASTKQLPFAARFLETLHYIDLHRPSGSRPFPNSPRTCSPGIHLNILKQERAGFIRSTLKPTCTPYSRARGGTPSTPRPPPRPRPRPTRRRPPRSPSRARPGPRGPRRTHPPPCCGVRYDN